MRNSSIDGHELSPDDETWFDWLGSNPAQLVRDEIARLLQSQVPGTMIDQIQLGNPPLSVAGFYPSKTSVNQLVVAGAGLAVKFVAQVRPGNEEREQVEGFLTWIAVGLNGDGRREKVYLDLGEDADIAENQLLLRMLELQMAGQNQLTNKPFAKVISMRAKVHLT